MPKGSPHAHFQRAVERRHLLSAEATPRQLGTLSLADALALTILIAEEAPERFPRVGARWHARLVLETRGVGVADSQLALAAVAALPSLEAANALAAFARRYAVANAEAVVRLLATERR